jgi:formate hydrogenlyase subunit 6/NADH:ubiquinone oxidoreductase subunit I
MFKILQKTVSTGTVTANYPAEPIKISDRFRGRPSFDFDKWKDARPAAEVCPTGAISLSDKGDSRKVTVDYGLCVFCGLCAEASSEQAVRITQEFELATPDRRNLVLTAEYTLNADRTHRGLRKVDHKSVNVETDVESLGKKARETIQNTLRDILRSRGAEAYLRLAKEFMRGGRAHWSIYLDILNVFGNKYSIIDNNDGFWYPSGEGASSGTHLLSGTYGQAVFLSGTRTAMISIRLGF